MKKALGLIVGLMVTLPTWADVDLEPLLNKVTLQLQAEQWLTTKTALVNVGVNAAVTDQGIEAVQSDVMQKLSQIAGKTDWHIVAFNRQQDASGLESIQIAAQARLEQADLAGMRDKAKNISKPGEKFTIDSVQFTPSEDEVRQANSVLRNNIYQQAKTEIDTLNKAYPEQKYYLHTIDFTVSAPVAPMPMTMLAGNMALNRAVSAPVSVGNKLQLQATVNIAAMPDAVAQKLMHN